MRKIERIIFFLLLTTIPIQLGKHFWPNFSFVQGIRVDYISPTLYLTDIILILLFALSIKRLYVAFFKVLKNKLFIFLLVALSVSALLAKSPYVSYIGIFILVKLTYFALYVSREISSKNFSRVVLAFLIGSAFTLGILILQFVAQSSIGGVFYFFGERTFYLSTPGISSVDLIGKEILRPYATFPHPNVASFYLLTTLFLYLFWVKSKKARKVAVPDVFIILLLVLGIGITFSRIILLLTISILTIFFWNYIKEKRKLSVFLFFILIPLILFFVRPESFFQDLTYRMQLGSIALNIFLISPIFGVGLNNFFYHEIIYQKNITPILLQPVHNIYLLILSTTGILGSGIIFVFIKKLFQRLIDKRYFLVFFASTLFIGFFDHYLLTLHQGQLLTAFTIGMFYSKIAE